METSRASDKAGLVLHLYFSLEFSGSPYVLFDLWKNSERYANQGNDQHRWGMQWHSRNDGVCRRKGRRLESTTVWEGETAGGDREQTAGTLGHLDKSLHFTLDKEEEEET